MIIDDKGRLFGKMNIIDLFVVIVVLAVIAAAAYRLVPRSKPAAPAEAAATGDVYVTVMARLVPEEVGEQLAIGDKLVAKGTYTSAEIVSVDVTPAMWVAWTADGTGVNTVHPIWKDVTVVIKDKGSPSNPIVKAGGQEARTGLTTYLLKTQKVEVPATVLDVEFK